MNEKDEIIYSILLAKIFFFAGGLALGGVAFWAVQDLDVDSVLYVTKELTFPVIVLACLGFCMGKIIDYKGSKSKKVVQKLKY